MILDKTIRNVVSTIRLFEKGFTSVQRDPEELATRVGSVSEFVECRLNFEMRKMKEFSEFERCTGGHLMKVNRVTNERSRGYDRIQITVGDKPDWIDEDYYSDMVRRVTELIGGSFISFSDNKRELKISVE